MKDTIGAEKFQDPSFTAKGEPRAEVALTIEELADYLKLKPQTIYKWAQTGKIPGAKFGKEWRFRRSLIEKWIDSRISSQPERSTESKGKKKGQGPSQN